MPTPKERNRAFLVPNNPHEQHRPAPQPHHEPDPREERSENASNAKNASPLHHLTLHKPYTRVRHAPIIILHCFEPPSANPHIEPITAHSALTPDAFPSLPEAAAPRPVPRRSVRRYNAPELLVYGPEHVTMRGRLGGVTLLLGSVPVVL
jgi:hypothetical protein